MGKKANQVRYAGDTGKFRKALADAGFDNFNTFGSLRWMFNDVTKSRATRRIKLWMAGDVFTAPQKMQRKLERNLKAEFGTRYLGGHFVKSSYWPGMSGNNCKSLCIRLTGY
jgi:hypothetical protein